jgi:hypothetical protein
LAVAWQLKGYFRLKSFRGKLKNKKNKEQFLRTLVKATLIEFEEKSAFESLPTYRFHNLAELLD